MDFDLSEKVWEYPSLGLNILLSTKESHDLPEIKLSIMQIFFYVLDCFVSNPRNSEEHSSHSLKSLSI